jgi:phage baseplate assembly protein W
MRITRAPKLVSWRQMRDVVMKYLNNLIAWGDSHFRQSGSEANCPSPAMPDDDAHIRELIDQILFTSPGERVTRPEFCAGLSEFVFEPITGESVAALKSAIQQELDQRLNKVIKIDEVQIAADESRLQVTIQYVVLSSSKCMHYAFCLDLQ